MSKTITLQDGDAAVVLRDKGDQRVDLETLIPMEVGEDYSVAGQQALYLIWCLEETNFGIRKRYMKAMERKNKRKNKQKEEEK